MYLGNVEEVSHSVLEISSSYDKELQKLQMDLFYSCLLTELNPPCIAWEEYPTL